MDYAEAIAILERSKEKFEFPVKWGIDLQSEHERFLTEHPTSRGSRTCGMRSLSREPRETRGIKGALGASRAMSIFTARVLDFPRPD